MPEVWKRNLSQREATTAVSREALAPASFSARIRGMIARKTVPLVFPEEQDTFFKCNVSSGIRDLSEESRKFSTAKTLRNVTNNLY